MEVLCVSMREVRLWKPGAADDCLRWGLKSNVTNDECCVNLFWSAVVVEFCVLSVE